MKGRLSYVTVARIPGPRAHSLQIAHTCEALARHLDEVELVIPRTSGATGPRGVRLVRLPTPDFLPLGRWAPSGLMQLLFNVQSVLFTLVALARAVIRRRADVYYTRTPLVAFAFALVFGARVVLELHIPPLSSPRQRLLRLYRRCGGRFVTISDALRREVARALGMPLDEIGVAHDGYDPVFFHPQPDRRTVRRRYALPQDAMVFVYVGSLATLGAAKGVRLLVEAFQKAALKDAVLVLAGIGPTVLHACPPNVRPLGRLAPHAIPSLLAACDVALMSFPDDPAYARAMSPLKLFEYLAAGRPIVAPDLPNLREVLDESCAVLVPSNDPKDIAAAMQRLAHEPAYRHALGQAAHQRAADYSWDARAERLVQFFNSPSHRRQQC